MERHFPGTRLRLLQADITDRLTLPPLDGIVAANAIHFVQDQTALLRQWRAYLKPEGRLVVVEYDSETGNGWVPYPMSHSAFQKLAPAVGFAEPVLLGVRPSRWLASIYAALTVPVMTSSAVETSRRRS